MDITEDEHDNPYTGLVGDGAGSAWEEAHWAFGTGFDDPLAGVDTTVPGDVDPAGLARICLCLADDGLIHAQRLAEWIAHGPEVEEEIALGNIGLDLIGQARLLYARAALADPSLLSDLPGDPVGPEDALAFFRDEDRFTNVCLAELPRGDFAFTIVRLFALSSWRLAQLGTLSGHRDPVLSAIAARGVKEVDYHRDHAARWCVTLAQGTEESCRRMEAALQDAEPWLAELAANPDAVWEADWHVTWDAACRADWDTVLRHAALHRPAPPVAAAGARYDGRAGLHTDHLAPLLEGMQEIARAHPEGTW
jgi:ring-1,2-phenylacetyl-CoA epoxidase subunit PaaC